VRAYNVSGIRNIYLGLRVKYPVSVPDFKQIMIFSTYFHKSPLSNFTEIRRIGAALMLVDGQTDRHDGDNMGLFMTMLKRLIH